MHFHMCVSVRPRVQEWALGWTAKFGIYEWNPDGTQKRTLRPSGELLKEVGGCVGVRVCGEKGGGRGVCTDVTTAQRLQPGSPQPTFDHRSARMLCGNEPAAPLRLCGVVQWFIRLGQLPARIAAAANGVQGKVMEAV